ncbi:hypothetical protein [Ruegeria arenilitoris]|uniref:hypothetical protein n=1 Tax=Ruegeria arenilitoris TaxID=1173585 RepID=UPI001480421B|nr:hypothetical protein [Ruegeria arenilitoris]
MILSLVSLGVAHKSANEESSPDLAAFMAAGGSLSDLCGLPIGDGPLTLVDCDACRIADSCVVLRGSSNAAIATLEYTRTFTFVAKRIARTAPLDATRLTRAPPSV